MKTILCTLLLNCSCTINAFSLFTPNYAKLPPQERIQKLQQEQVSNPTDALTNYNLGVALYKNNQFGEANNNFKRSAQYALPKSELSNKSLFNIGTTSYRQALSILPSGWEGKETNIDNNITDQAIAHTKSSIESYKKLLEQTDQHEQASTNLKKAETLLKKLAEKKKQQEQQQQSQDQSPNKQEDKGNQKSGDQPKQEDKGANPSDQTKKPEQEGSNDKLDHKEGKDKEEQKSSQHHQPQKKHSQDQPDKQPTSQGKQGEEKKQEAGQSQAAAMGKQQEDNTQKQGMQALLDALQSDESKLQKDLLSRKIQQTEPPQQTGQKPW